MKNRVLILPILAALLPSAAPAAVIFSEDFGTAVVNPTATTFTTQQTWNYSDSAGTAVGSNESRLYTPGGGGSATNSVGWISLLGGGNTFQQIQSNGTFAALPTLNPGESYQITINWFGASDTTNAATSNLYVAFSSAGNTLSSFNGHNLSNTVTLSDSDAATDAVRMDFVGLNGGGGFTQARLFTTSFTTTDDLNGDAFSIALGRTTGTPFAIFDNVSIDVTVVPEPSVALLGGLGALALLRRRRA